MSVGRSRFLAEMQAEIQHEADDFNARVAELASLRREHTATACGYAPEPSCGTCRFWYPQIEEFAPGLLHSWHTKTVELTPAERTVVQPGRCRRHAPALEGSADRNDIGWPVTRPDDWCGDWAGRGPSQEYMRERWGVG